MAYDESSATVGIPHLSGLAAGDSEILYYELSWDRGLLQASWSVYTVVAASTTQITVRALTSGAKYAFRYRAQNVHGWSKDGATFGYSPVVTVTVMRVPAQGTPVTTSMLGDKAILTWAEPYTGGLGVPVSAYTILIRDGLQQLAEETALCDGSTDPVLTARRCEIAMADLTAEANPPEGSGIRTLFKDAGRGLARGELLVAQVAATNAKGQGVFSTPNSSGVTAQVVPSAPPNAPRRGGATSTSLVDVQWDFLTAADADGGSAILSYSLEADDGQGGEFVAAVGGSPETEAGRYTLNSHSLTTAIISGLAYRVRYRAYNAHGWGPYSPIGEIRAATPPAAPLAPTLSEEATSMKISWSAPADTGGTGVAITAYRIEIQLSTVLPDGTVAYKQDLSSAPNCDGSLASIFAADPCCECFIPMALLTSTDVETGFGFTQGQGVAARVTVANAIGFGIAGALSGATVLAQVVPAKPANPPRRGAGTDEARIVIDWDAINSPADGGSGVTSYNLQWDQGTGAFPAEGNHDQALTAATGGADYPQTTHEQTAALEAGKAYRFRYRAANKHGWGPYSDSVTILAADIPAAPAAAVTSIADIFVKVAWTAPDDRSSTIT